MNDIDALRDMLAHSPNMIVVNLFTFIGIGIFLFGEKLATCARCHRPGAIHRACHGKIRAKTPADL